MKVVARDCNLASHVDGHKARTLGIIFAHAFQSGVEASSGVEAP